MGPGLSGGAATTTEGNKCHGRRGPVAPWAGGGSQGHGPRGARSGLAQDPTAPRCFPDMALLLPMPPQEEQQGGEEGGPKHVTSVGPSTSRPSVCTEGPPTSTKATMVEPRSTEAALSAAQSRREKDSPAVLCEPVRRFMLSRATCQGSWGAASLRGCALPLWALIMGISGSPHPHLRLEPTQSRCPTTAEHGGGPSCGSTGFPVTTDKRYCP